MTDGEPNAAVAIADEPYLEAIRLCPLRPIRTEAELDRAIAAIDRLIDKGAAGLRSTQPWRSGARSAPRGQGKRAVCVRRSA